MLLTKEVEVELTGINTNHYKILGYEIPIRKDRWGNINTARGTKIKVKVEDLPDNSHIRVDIECDCCHRIVYGIIWHEYKKYTNKNGKDFCNWCTKNGCKPWTSFERWCINNNRHDVLNRWDYELSNRKPSEIPHSSMKKFYFKCPKEIHKSELKSLHAFTQGQEGSIKCRACNSFAQWGIDNICEDFLEKYWDYEKNVVNPWEIDYGSKKHVWIKCQEKDYHGSYNPIVSNFVGHNSRCPYCSNVKGKVHPKDSLGVLLESKGLLYLWSDKNKKSPYIYAPNSCQFFWWKCGNGIHEDYYRKANDSNIVDFRCAKCQFSKGESKIEIWLRNENIYFESHKTFSDLRGSGNGLLSYDFWIPSYGLIEYQGQYHDGSVSNQTNERFEYQKDHDRRKKEYAENHSIKLLEIWYCDFDNIEEILNKELNITMQTPSSTEGVFNLIETGMEGCN